MKKIAYFSAICITLSILLSCGTGSQSSKTIGITKELLMKSEFRYGINAWCGGNLKFLDDNTYTDDYACEGDYDSPTSCGTYEIKDDKVIMKHTKCVNSEGTIECNDGNKEMEATIVEDMNDVSYSKYLVIKIINFKDSVIKCPFEESKVKEGEKKAYDNIPVITMGDKEVKLAKTSWLKEKPSVSSKSVGEELNAEEFEMTGQSLKVIARTENTENINGTDCYWYLVDFNIPNVSLIRNVWISSDCVKE